MGRIPGARTLRKAAHSCSQGGMRFSAEWKLVSGCWSWCFFSKKVTSLGACELWGKFRLTLGWDLSCPAGIAPHIPQAFLWERISSVVSLGLCFQCLMEGDAASGCISTRSEGLTLPHLRNIHSPIICTYLCHSICSKSWCKDECKLKQTLNKTYFCVWARCAVWQW